MKTSIQIVEGEGGFGITLLINGNRIVGPGPGAMSTVIADWRIPNKKLRKALGYRFGRRVTYRFIENKKRQPIITSCTIEEPNGEVGIGYAICSKSELHFNGKDGKKIAYQRAELALAFQMSGRPIKRKRAMERIHECGEPVPTFKSLYIGRWVKK